MLCQARSTVEIGDRAEGQNEVVVGDFTLLSRPGVHYSYNFVLQVDRFNVSNSHLCMAKHFPKRLHNIRNRQVCARNLMKHGREENKVLFCHKLNFNIWRVAEPPLEMQGSVCPGKATAEDQDASLGRVGVCHTGTAL